MKQAYYKAFSIYEYEKYKKAEITGLCKTIRGGPYGIRKMTQIQHRLLGIPLWKSWIDSEDVYYFNKETVEYYTCDCGE